MAVEWIKMTKSLLEGKPEVRKLCRILKQDKFSIIGRLFAFWSWVDTHFTSVDVIDATKDDIDDITDLDGFADALVKVGWLCGRESRYTIPNLDRHNGQTARARALEAEARRIRREEEKVNNVANEDEMSDTCPTFVGRNVRPEKSRIYKNSNSKGKGKFHGGYVDDDKPPPNYDFSALRRNREFVAWVKRCLMLNNGWEKLDLNDSETFEAWAAYKRSRLSERDFQLLTEVYRRRPDKDRKGKPFWWTDARKQFFKDMADIMANAERWAKETKWKPAQIVTAEPTHSEQLAPTEPPMSDEEFKKTWEELKKETGMD